MGPIGIGLFGHSSFDVVRPIECIGDAGPFDSLGMDTPGVSLSMARSRRVLCSTLYGNLSSFEPIVFEFYVHYFAFSQDTGWDRIRIWHYGWLSIFNHPIFGIGYHEYQRPEWMEPSIDMFWLINFVRFGYPGGILMFLTFAWVFFSTALKKGLTEQQNDYRTAYLISMIGVFTVGWTVHFWNAPYLLIMFYLGSVSWIQDIEGGEGQRLKPGPRRAGSIMATRS